MRDRDEIRISEFPKLAAFIASSRLSDLQRVDH